MSYVITTTSGNVLLTLQDGTTDTSTGMVLIGKNYTGYGLLQNDNFVRLAENFASTIPPNQSVGTAVLTGTQWYDTANRLIKVYDGTNFNPVSGRIAANASPTARNVGDQWWDTGNLQLNSWNGSSWQLVGPSYTAGQGLSGQSVANVADIGSVNRTILKDYVSGNLVSIYSATSFAPNVAIANFGNITAGLTLANNVSFTANTATFANNITVGQTVTANVVTAGIVNASGNVTAGNLTITNTFRAAAIYDNGNRAVTSITAYPGAGIAVSGNTTGPTANITITNTGVISLASSGPGITLNGATGNIQITNSGVTSAIAGTGMHLTNTIGAVVFSIGQEVSSFSVPTFAGLSVSGAILPLSNVAINLGGGTQWYNNIYGFDHVGTNFNGVTFTGNAFNGNVVAVNTVSGTAINGVTYTGTTYNGTTYNGTTYNGSNFAGVNYTGNTYTGTTYNGVTFNGTTFSGQSTTALYADLAEKYSTDGDYLPGTVVVFGGEAEVTTSKKFADVSVAGVVSTNPAYLMNQGLANGLPIALRGRVPVLVIGTVKKGDLLVSAHTFGCAQSVGTDASYGVAIFAKALEDKTTNEIELIEAVII